MTFYRRNLPHLQRDHKPHFITFVTKNRSVLSNCARDIVLGCCQHDHETNYRLHAAVVMPDHVHLILTPLVDFDRALMLPLPEIMQAIKSSSAHLISRRSACHGTIWQDESSDRVLRCSEKLDEKIAYILNNPVRRVIVADWREYRWVWYQEPPSAYAAPACVLPKST